MNRNQTLYVMVYVTMYHENDTKMQFNKNKFIEQGLFFSPDVKSHSLTVCFKAYSNKVGYSTAVM